MKFFFILIEFLFFCRISVSQSIEADSLVSSISYEKRDSGKIQFVPKA